MFEIFFFSRRKEKLFMLRYFKKFAKGCNKDINLRFGLIKHF